MVFDYTKRHIMDLTHDEEMHATDLLTRFKLKNPERFLYKDVTYEYDEHKGKCWTAVYFTLWNEILYSHNAKYVHKMREVYNNKHPLHMRMRQLDYMYEQVTQKRNYYEDLAYSYHYMLQLHIQFIFDSIEPKDDSCVTHNDIKEYNNIDMEVEECFCGSLFDKPRFCLYCRNPKFYNYKYIES